MQGAAASEITIIATPRSGTNYFCDTLGEFEPFANLFEIFNPRGVFGIQRFSEIFAHFSALVGKDIQDVSDPDLIAYAAGNRLSFLEEMRKAVAAAGKSAFAYKIFPNQMPGDTLDAILSNPERRFIFIVRNRIDTFISYKKALAHDNWVNASTADIRVEVDFDEFMDWARGQDRWYAETERRLREAGQRYVIFSYDSDINVAKETLIEKQYLALRSLGIDLPYPDRVSPPTYKRQDKIAGPFTKIANGEALKKKFISRRLLGSYALRTPMIPMPVRSGGS